MIIMTGEIRENDELWQGVDGINNPCPLGFRLPTIAEWENEKNNWSQGSSGAYASKLRLTTGGERYFNGNIWKTGEDGNYWFSTKEEAMAKRLFFGNNFIYLSYYGRVHGAFVRCIKDE